MLGTGVFIKQSVTLMGSIVTPCGLALFKLKDTYTCLLYMCHLHKHKIFLYDFPTILILSSLLSFPFVLPAICPLQLKSPYPVFSMSPL